MKVHTWARWCITLYAMTAFGVVHAHYPHDAHRFIALSPNFSVDSTTFIAQKQASSTRPDVALMSRNGGLSWRYNPAGMDNISRFTSATVSPLYALDNTVFMTTAGQGLYRSVDGGRIWVKENQGLPTLKLRDSAAGLDAADSVVLFVSGTGGGLFRSADSGLSWAVVLAESNMASAFALSPDFAVDGAVIAGDSSGVLFISSDGGTTFTQNDSLADIGEITRIVFAPDYLTSREIYVGTSVGLYHSSDAGMSFVKVDSFATDRVSALALSTDYGTDLTLFATTPTQGVFKSTDAGLTWVLNETGVPPVAQTNYHFHDLEVSDDFANDGVVFLATFEGLFRSVDGGISWTELETRPPTLINGVALSPDFAQDGLMVVSTYGGGLYVSRDAGNTWIVSNNGVSGTFAYQVAVREGAGPEPILLASHENHALISFDSGASWTEKEVAGVLPKVCIGSSMDASPAFASDQTLFLGCRRDGLAATYDGGDTWQLLITAEQLSGRSITSVKVSPNFAADSTMFFTDLTGDFGRSRDGGNTWKLITKDLPKSWFGGASIAISPDFSNDNFIMAGTPEGCYSSSNGGNRWRPTPDAASPVASGVIEHVAMSPDFAQDRTALASVRGAGLFRTGDGGITWQQVGTGLLENGYVLTGFVFSPNFAQDGVIIGFGHDHLLRSSDRGSTFELFDIPFVRHEDGLDQSVRYVGNWSKAVLETASANSLRAAEKAGRQALLSFWGTGVSWIGLRADVLGIAKVYIDGNLAATVDQYNLSWLWQQNLYSVEGLPLGLHEIRVEATNTKNPDAIGAWTTIDAFDVLR